MYNSRFDYVDGRPDEAQVENWTEEFFFNLMTIFNSFFATIDLKDAVQRIIMVPFDKLLLEQLPDENEKVKEIAVAKIKELAAIEIEFLQHYCE